MAITFKSATVTDLEGNTVGVHSAQVVEIVDNGDGTVEILTPVDGEGLQSIGSENTASKGSVVITGGTGDITNLTVDGVAIIGGTVTAEADTAAGRELQAFNLAVAINSFESTPNYTATVSTNTVTISADKALGASPDTFVVATTSGGTLTTTDNAFAGGASVLAALITDFTTVLTLTTDKGDRTLNSLRISSINHIEGSPATTKLKYRRDFGEYCEEIVVEDTPANVITAVNAL